MYGGVCRGGRDGSKANPNHYRQLRAYLRGNWLSLAATFRSLLATAVVNDYRYIWHYHVTPGWRAGLNDESISQVINP